MACETQMTEAEVASLFGSNDPFPRWSWDTYAHHARFSKNAARKRAVARWKIRTWEQNFSAYAADGHRQICADCGEPTSPRDPVFDLCRGCERQWRADR